MNIELAGEVTEKGMILPDGKAVMTVDQAKSFIVERMNLLEMTVAERVSAALSRHDQLAYDLKELHRVDEMRAKNQVSLNARVAAIEKKLSIEPFKVDPEHPGTGNWKLTAQANIKPRPRAPRLTGPDPAWHKEAEAAAEKLQAELPPRVSLPQLVRTFGVSRTRLDALIGKGKLEAVREDTHTFVTRESLIKYVRENGIPQPQSRHYGGLGKQDESET